MKVGDLDFLATGTFSDEKTLRDRAYWEQLQGDEHSPAIEIYERWGGTLIDEAAEDFRERNRARSAKVQKRMYLPHRRKDEAELRRIRVLMRTLCEQYDIDSLQFDKGACQWIGNDLFISEETESPLFGLPKIEASFWTHVVPYWASAHHNYLTVRGLSLSKRGIDHYKVSLVRNHRSANWEEGKWEYMYTTNRRSR